MLLRVDHAEELTQEVEVRKLLLSHGARIEVEVEVSDAVCIDVTEEHLCAREVADLERQRVRLLADVGELEDRYRAQGLLRLRALLALLQRARRRNCRLDLRFAHRGLLRGELFLLLLLTARGHLRVRHHREQAAVRVREEVLLNKRLEVAAREAILHLLQQVLIAQVRLRCPAVEPALHDADAVDEALRRRAEVRFAQAELHEVDGSLEQLAVDAVLGELLQLRHGQMVEGIEALRLRIVDDDAEERLQHVRLEDGVDILAKLCIDECLAQRRSWRAQEGVLEDLEAHHRLVVERLARRPAQCEEGLLGRALLLADRIEDRLALEMRELRLQVNLRRHGDAVEMREVFLVEVAQLLRDVHRAVEVDVAVRRMVVLRMEGDERLLREVRDGLGVAARLMAVRRRRVERVHDAALEQVVRRGERALHLVVDDAAVRERVLRLLDLIVPALLHEDLRVLAHVRVEDGVEVDVHEVLEVLVVAAGHWVHRLVRIRHRVEEGVE